VFVAKWARNNFMKKTTLELCTKRQRNRETHRQGVLVWVLIFSFFLVVVVVVVPQGPAFTRHALYHLRHTLSLYGLGFFREDLALFTQAGLRPQTMILLSMLPS
jgi:hypothetical protein